MDQEPKIVVYQAVNKVNGKRYIGITNQGLGRRRSEHWHASAQNRGYLIGAAIRKYGRENIEFSVLIVCETYAEAQEHEIRLISEHSPEYNITKGGGGVLGLKWSSEAREAARHRLLAKPLRYWQGKKRDPALMAKMVAARRGKPMTSRQLEARQENIKRAAASKFRAIRCVDLDVAFPSVVAAAAALRLNKANIVSVCKGRHRTAGGLVFQYVEGE